MHRSSGKVLKKRPGFWISGCLTQEGCPSSPLTRTTFWLCHLLTNINISLQNQFEDASPSPEGARLSWCPSRSPRTCSTPPPCCRRRTHCTPRRRWSRCRRWRGGARCRVCTTSAGRRGRLWSSRGTNKRLERILRKKSKYVLPSIPVYLGPATMHVRVRILPSWTVQDCGALLIHTSPPV